MFLYIYIYIYNKTFLEYENWIWIFNLKFEFWSNYAKVLIRPKLMGSLLCNDLLVFNGDVKNLYNVVLNWYFDMI